MPKSRVAILVIAAAMFGVVIASALELSPLIDAGWKGKVRDAAEVTPSSAPRMMPVDITTLAKEVSPAVVNVSTTQVRIDRPTRPRSPFGGRDPFDDFFNNFFGNGPREQKRRSLGSGFIVSEDGYILTNAHVVDKSDEVKVTLLDGDKDFKADVVGTDPKTDIALIKIKAGRKLPYVRLGDSDRLQIGEWVVAIGNPFGLGHTVTQGIVSAKGRVIGSGPYDDFIQTDASINPGNSGGPLFDLKGEVVGINTAIIQGGQGIGFATPINLARSVFNQLKEKGKVTRGWLGVYIQRITPEVAESLGLPDRKGALVADVTKDGPAEKAGIKSGDVIVAFDGRKVNDEHELPQIVAQTPVGKKVDVTVVRDGKRHDIPVTIGEMEPEPGRHAKGGGTDLSRGLGLTVQDITPDVARNLEVDNRNGVVVTSVEDGTPADEAGFQEGDIIRQVNRQSVKNSADFEKAVNRFKKEKTVLFLVERGEARIFLAVRNR
jgi:serine protease Do